MKRKINWSIIQGIIAILAISALGWTMLILIYLLVSDPYESDYHYARNTEAFYVSHTH